MTWGKGPAFDTVREWLCECCGKKITLSAEDAYEKGWDVPPYFTGYIKCEDCPITKTMLWMMLQELKGVDTNNESR